MNQLKFFRVSALISSTRQAMTAYFFAVDEISAYRMFGEMTGLTRDRVKLVCDEVPIKEGFVTITHNDREVLSQHFPPRDK